MLWLPNLQKGPGMKHGCGLGSDRHQYVTWIISGFLMWSAMTALSLIEIFIFLLHTDSFGWSLPWERGANQVIKKKVKVFH